MMCQYLDILEFLGIQGEKFSIYLNCLRKAWFYDGFANRLGAISRFFLIYLKRDVSSVHLVSRAYSVMLQSSQPSSREHGCKCIGSNRICSGQLQL